MSVSFLQVTRLKLRRAGVISCLRHTAALSFFCLTPPPSACLSGLPGLWVDPRMPPACKMSGARQLWAACSCYLLVSEERKDLKGRLPLESRRLPMLLLEAILFRAHIKPHLTLHSPLPPHTTFQPSPRKPSFQSAPGAWGTEQTKAKLGI